MDSAQPKHKTSLAARRAEREKEARNRERLSSEGFDVTCKIGRIEPGEGDLNVFEAAFVMIARHDTDGVFHFAIPSDDGDSYEVSVKRHVRPVAEQA